MLFRFIGFGLSIFGLLFLCGFFFETQYEAKPKSFIETSGLYFIRSETSYFKSRDYPARYLFFKPHYFYEGRKYFINTGLFLVPKVGAYLYIKDFYYKIKGKKLVFGAKNLKWFKAESLWHDGYWSAVFAYDPLQGVVEQGPIGFIGEKGDFKFFLQTSSNFEIRNSVTLDKGLLISKTPWASLPHEEIELSGITRKIKYKLNFPTLKNLLWTPGIGLLWAKTFYKSQHNTALKTSWSIGYAFKPSFSFLLKGAFSLPVNEDPVEVEINPNAFFHHLLSFEVNKEKRRLSLSQNFTYDYPLLKSYELTKYILQKRPPAFLSTSYIGYKVSPNLQFFSSYRYVYQKFDTENSISKKEFFSSPFLFFNAVSLGLRVQLYLREIESDSTLKLVYDLEQKGGIVSWKVDFHLNESLKAFFLLEFIGLVGGDIEKQINNRKHFLRDVRANDRIQGGFHYVF